MAKITDDFLLKAVTGDIPSNPDFVVGDGGAKTLYVYADDFGGGTVSIQTSFTGGSLHWGALENAAGTPVTFTANGAVRIETVGQSAKIRANLSGSTAPVNVNAKLVQ